MNKYIINSRMLCKRRKLKLPLGEAIKALLFNRPHLRSKDFQRFTSVFRGLSSAFGHCYVASEVYYHLSDEDLSVYRLSLPYGLGTHWFLRNNDTNKIIDLTMGQFQDSFQPEYDNAVKTGFLTKKPSKRAQEIIDLLEESKE